jgi:diguanylate cyclase (GGDEF)-like protein
MIDRFYKDSIVNKLMIPASRKVTWLLILFFLTIPIIGILDFITGPDITFALIYLLPVSAIAWLNNRFAIFLASALTVATWIAVDFLSGRFPLDIVAYLWNFSSRFLVLEGVAILLSVLKHTLLESHELSRKDPLTQALNIRTFMELAENEIYRSMRSGTPLTLVYLDVDNFKAINDTYGHNAGNVLLLTIVQSIQQNTRKNDLVARLGGDEFAILLPDTGFESARITMTKIREILLKSTEDLNWPVTFSIGALTCIQMPETVEALIGMADKLMYTVKAGSKNDVAFSLYP